MTSQPFDDIRNLTQDLPRADPVARDRASAGGGGPGTLSAMAAWIAEWRGEAVINRPIFAIYVGGHAGVDQAGITRQLMERIAAGDTRLSRAAAHLGAGLDVYELAIDRPVPDLADAPTMSERECAATIAFGMESLAKQPDLLCLFALGGAGRLNAAGALAHALHFREAADWTADAPAQRIEAAVGRARAAADGDPLQLLRQVGGRETAALVGAILAARIQRVPILLAGYPGLAAAAVVKALHPDALDHCRLAFASPQGSGPRRLADALALTPWIDIYADGAMDEADGTGCAAALSLIRLACAVPPPRGL